MNRYLFPAILVALALGVYLNSLPAPFCLDDVGLIVNEWSVRKLWRFGAHANRPFLSFTLSLNYAFGELDPSGYRFVNIVIHASGALLLFGLLRRTMRLPRFGMAAPAADGIAFAIASLWVVHPLHVSCVTYVWQRCESLMGMLFLATVYAAVRLAEGGRRWPWTAVLIVCFLLGLGTKEVMVTVIPVLLLFDGILLSPSFRAALRARLVVYGTFAVVVVAAAVVVLPKLRTSFIKVSPWEYALSQPGIVLDYLRMTVWPYPLSFDWSAKPAQGLVEIALPALVIAALLAATAWGLRRRAWQGVAGAWFFLILAPTSSFVVINDLKVEYRMYLPSIAVITLLVVGARLLCRRYKVPPIAPLLVGLAVLGGLTIARNHDFLTSIRLWRSVLEVVPDNHRAHSFLVPALLEADRTEEAVYHARRALEQKQTHLSHWNLGTALTRSGELEEALEHYREAAKIKPRNHDAHRQIAAVLLALDRPDQALESLDRALAIDARSAESHALRAHALERLGRNDAAIAACRRAVNLQPKRFGAWRRLGRLNVAVGDHAEAERAFRTALQLQPNHPETHRDLAGVLAELGAYDEALIHFETTLRAVPASAASLSQLAIKVLRGNGPPAGKAMAVRVCELSADATRSRDAGVLLNLGRAYRVVGRNDDARRVYDAVLRLPDVANDPAKRLAVEREKAAM